MMPFSDHIEGLLQREGGYVNNPADRGGETNYGITKATARANGYAGQMRDLPRATAIQIYKRQYWAAARLDEVDAIAPRLAGKLFDIGVNAGPARAGRFLQRALNYFVGGLAVDGKIGPATLAALHALAKKGGRRLQTKTFCVSLTAFWLHITSRLLRQTPASGYSPGAGQTGGWGYE